MLNRTLEGQTGITVSASMGTTQLGLPSTLGSARGYATESLYAAPRSLESTEVRRRLLHMLPGLFPFILAAIPHKDPWGPILANVVIAVTALIVGPSLYRFAAFARPGEQDGRSSILGYAFPIIFGLWFFHGWEEIGMMTLAILAFGDGSATLCGLTLGGRRLPWNTKKTVTGLLCFMLIGGPLATVAFWGECRPGTTWAIAAACGFGATIAAALAESIPSKINDNLRVGATAMFMGALLHVVLVG